MRDDEALARLDAVRRNIHVNQTSRFKKYLESIGWTIEEPKGEYERIRARSGRQIFIAYKRERDNYLSFRHDDWKIVQGFRLSLKSKLVGGEE